ncbi:type II secretion system F family protein [Comamonas sp. Y6]|uniref:Type II secretion system F family protein n=1 Tax=Comamonas resistens TaxID=3046670 RepID=A0ABY8SV16_9BURK|nr:type II secretion system F family protein [Comamonas resistens]MDL5035526.1 type II secretion system F family protein [Comamonas resistens]WHS66421.1 type II secretion system F family protein [Comamonas resistens]
MLIIALLTFTALMLAAGALFFWLTPTATAQRLQALSPASGQSHWTETAIKLVGPFAQLSSPTEGVDATPLRLRFLNAGIRNEHAPLLYFGIKTLLPLVMAFAVYSLMRASSTTESSQLLLFPLAAALVACYLPNLVLRWLAKQRKREIFENFPDAADLMLVCVEAGLGLDAALGKVTDEIRIKSEALAEELHWTNLEIRAGSTREKSLRNLAARTRVDEIYTFAAMLTQADRFGTSIGDSLRVFSEDLRHKRQIRAEELAAKIPTKMLFPLVTCIFPAIVMVVLGPAIIQIVRMVGPMFAGTS